MLMNLALNLYAYRATIKPMFRSTVYNVCLALHKCVENRIKLRLHNFRRMMMPVANGIVNRTKLHTLDNKKQGNTLTIRLGIVARHAYSKVGILLLLCTTLAHAQPVDIPQAANLNPNNFYYCNYKPSESALHRFFENRALAFARKLYTLYPNRYSHPSYTFSITHSTIDGESAHASASYRGSVLEVATGKRVHASGTIHAEFIWEACSWHIEDYRYTTKP